MTAEQDTPVIESSGEPLVSADLWLADPAADEGHVPARSLSEIQPDGEDVELPEGDRHHDEIANTDPANHGADTSAPVHTDDEGNASPQGFGWDASSLTESGGPEDESSGEPLVPAPTVEGEDDGKADDEPAGKRRPTSKRTSKRGSGKR